MRLRLPIALTIAAAIFVLLSAIASSGQSPKVRIYAPIEGLNRVLIYAADEMGNASPIITISGSNTGLKEPVGVALDALGKLYVVNQNEQVASTHGKGFITVFAANASGNATPLATIKGDHTKLFSATAIAVHNGKIFVTSFQGNYVTVYAAGANGNVAPIATIGGALTALNGPNGVAVDAAGRIYVTNQHTRTVTVYATGANGNIVPIETIKGPNTGFGAGVAGVAVDASGRMHVIAGNRVNVFASGSNGNVSPVATIAGSNTTIKDPMGVALDVLGRTYVSLGGVTPQGNPTNDRGLAVFAAGANGNVLPLTTIHFSASPWGLAVR
jgi:hypothetical protein